MNGADVETALRRPWVSIGSDGGAAEAAGKDDDSHLAHPRSYGTFPRIMARYVRERGVLSLEDAVRKMSGWPAARLGLTGRGICRLAFEQARKLGRRKVTCITKANVVKTTDGRFLENFYRVAKDYPGIEADDWYIDIMTAKLVDEKRRRDFQVMVLPNLYGDILTDEAAEFQGGVGTAGSANIGKQYAMFEAIHGSAPRMAAEGRARYADPCSMIRAAAMLIGHIGHPDKAKTLEMALDITGQYEKKIAVTGRPGGATGAEFTDYIMDWLHNPRLAATWEDRVKG